MAQDGKDQLGNSADSRHQSVYSEEPRAEHLAQAECPKSQPCGGQGQQLFAGQELGIALACGNYLVAARTLRQLAHLAIAVKRAQDS